MELIRGLYNLRAAHKGCAVTIGNFDGVHLGHQRVLKDVKAVAAEKGLATCVIIFEPQPEEFFLGEKAPARLTRLREKLQLLKTCEIDWVLCLRFNARFSQLSADDFIKHVLVEGLAVKYLVVGDDFRFGYQRSGDFAQLQSAASEQGFALDNIHTITNHKQRISSTLIREALATGDLVAAKRLLGRSYGMTGRVAHGDKRGRIIGFPTANLYLHRKVSPILGVYCVTVHGLGDKPIYGVANVGNRPTVDGTRTLLEVHLFDFDQEIYGRYVRVAFEHKLRDEKRYDSFDELKQQIFKDAEQARAFFR